MLVKLAFVMQRLKKYLKKFFVMINKDGGGTIFQFYGGHSCYEGGHRAHGGSPPTRENPDLYAVEGNILTKISLGRSADPGNHLKMIKLLTCG